MADAVIPPTPALNLEPAIQKFESVAGPVHTIILLLTLTAVAWLGYLGVHRQQLIATPHRLLFYLPTMAWEWLVFGYVYWGLRRRGKRFRNIAGARWKGVQDFFVDVGIGFGFWIAALFILAGVSRLVRAGGMAEAARNLAPHGLLEGLMWIALSVTAGICEETIFRGYLQRQFVAWTRNQPVGVVLSAALFGLGHIYQGARATIVIGVYGLMFGILAEVRQNLRPGIMVHAWHDSITGFAIRFAPKR